MTIYELLTTYQEAKTTAEDQEKARAAAAAARQKAIEAAAAAMDAAVAAGDQKAYREESMNLAFARAAAEKVEKTAPFFSMDEYNQHTADVAHCILQHRKETYGKIAAHMAEVESLLDEQKKMNNAADRCCGIINSLADYGSAFCIIYSYDPIPDHRRFTEFVKRRAGQ